jgi:hypothetical protein
MTEKSKFIQTSFFIPLYEDKDVGNGRLHSATRWTKFQSNLYVDFGTWTLAPGNYKGSYKDPDTGLEVVDLSRKYILAVPKKGLRRLKDFLKKEGIIFRQKYIYFEAAGKVELLKVNYEKIL